MIFLVASFGKKGKGKRGRGKKNSFAQKKNSINFMLNRNRNALKGL